MGSVVRLLSLSLCGALGIGIAICLATSSVPPQPTTTTSTASSAASKVARASDRKPARSTANTVAAKPVQSPNQKPASAEGNSQSPKVAADTTPGPVLVTPQPAFAQQPIPPANPDLVNRLEGAIHSLQNQQQERQATLNKTLEALQSLTGVDLPAATPAASPAPPAAAAPSASQSENNDPFADDKSLPRPAEAVASPPASRTEIKEIEGEGDGKLSIHIQDSDLREVLDLLAEQGGLNILASNSVQGKVSASLSHVDIDTALNAILRSTGFTARRDGAFVFVGTSKDFLLMDESVDKVGARIYRPNYIRATDLQMLIQPLLTPNLGVCSVTAPSEVGIAANDADAGGNSFAGGEAVLVRDFEAVLAQVDQVFEELDKRPMQVSIEAMILSVKLADKNSFGVDFALLRDQANIRLVSGKPLTDLGQMKFDGGLKFGFLDSSLGVFVTALETIGDVNVIATPRLMCINKHRAQILIGAQLGYVNTTLTETSTAQNVQFLEVGTQLRLRPFISNDGLIRMEVHPELSTGNVRVEEGFTLPDKELTQVTTNIMVRDGCTVIIGGLMREDLTTTTSQIPLLGSTPGIGFLFRQKTETIERRELIVLITPHIVYEPQACAEGDKGACDFHRRQAAYADHMSCLGTRYLGRKYFRNAQDLWARGDGPRALKAVNLAIHFDPESRAAIELRSDIMAGNHMGDHSGGNGVMQEMPLAPMQVDVPGNARNINKPGSMQ